MTHSLPEALSRNVGRVCDAPHCAKPRVGASVWCGHHLHRVQRYGGPNGRRITRHDYKQELAEVRAFLERHRAHVAVLAGLQVLVELFEEPELQRLRDAGVDAYTLLCELCAVYLLHRARPGLIESGKPLLYALANTALYAAPRERRRDRNGHWQYADIAPRIRHHVGKLILGALSPLLWNVVSTIEAERLAERQMRTDMQVPFA